MATNAFDQANLAFAQANSAYTQANAAFNKANTVSSSSGTFTVGDDLVVTNNVSVGGYIVPVEIGQNIGNVDYRWYNLYMDGGIYADGSFGNPGQILSSSDYGTLKWIDAPSGNTGGGGGGTVDSYARATANIASSTAQAAFNKANTAGASSTDAYARNTANTAYNNTIVIQAVNVTQNTRITTVQTTAQAAFDKANNVSALSGATGVAGASGISGATGIRGASGVAGASGFIGSNGATGVQGASGVNGATGAGLSGATGIQGATGVAGAAGATGTPGNDGTPGIDGATGAGLTGATGIRGATGVQGASGVGATGVGVQGASGSVGLTGASGAGLTGATGTAGRSGARNFGVTNSGASAYTIDGASNPTLFLLRGFTYTFTVDAFGHPFWIQSVSGAYSVGDIYNTGVTANGNQGGVITFAVPFDAPSTLYYVCQFHPSMAGTINIGDAAPQGASGPSGATGSQGVQGASGVGATGAGVAGATGSAGTNGASGANGADGATGPAGANGVDGASGVAGATGAGVSGATGTVGLTGATGTNNLVWGATGTTRTLTGYVENGTTSTVRTAAITGGVLSLTLATFTPSVSAVALASSSLNWDVACTGFTATADNPSDVVDQYVSSVASIAQVSGSIATTLGNYSAGSYTNTPAGGVDWSISYTPNNSTSYIRSTSTTITGGSASGTITFNYYNGSSFTTWGTTASFSVTWATPTHSISLGSLTGSTFLQTYNSVSYTVSGTGITTSANRVYAVTATGGTVSSGTGSGTFTFTTPIHKDNTATSRYTTLTTTLTRPVAVTGTSYTVTLGPTNTSSASASFTYPSYWLWTASVATVPTRADIINGTGVESGVTVLGDQVKALTTQAINNTDPNPRAFWFAVRTSASQPTTFKTGASAGLLSDVSYTDAGSIGLEPDSPPASYTAENYHLYGFTLQPGTTYVSIS